MKYRVTHITKYDYQTPTALCHNIVVQTPARLPFQQVKSYKYNIFPEPNYLATRKDFFDNEFIYFSVQKTHQKLLVESKSEVEIGLPAWANLDSKQTEPWEEVVSWLQTTDAMNDIRQFYLESTYVTFIPGVKEYALESFTPGRPVMDAMLDLNKRINKDFKFTPGFTDISTPLEEVFKHRKGVCQDFAHFSLACVRSLGLAAKYVSGYIETIPPPGKPKMVGADASHAWNAVYIPSIGWVEFDATNNLLVKDQHIRVAFGRDFADVVPLKGIVYSNGGQKMVVTVDVSRLS
ncbi:MAG: transglutaminase family protein [Imperialibacter sp.]|uniref:transglutaminase family protein n=1 Tax=Imperialibacter sp. TaxID=2038411 RepID=UPI003A873836